MRIVASTGTDVAAVAVGDPSQLLALRGSPSDFDAARDAAIAAGYLWRADTGADGAYLFHIFVDENPPGSLAAYLRDPQLVDRFLVPSGQLLVAGEEYFVGAQSLEKYPHMGEQVSIPPGEYHLTAFRVEAPDDHLEERFRAIASPAQRRAWSIGSAMPGWCIIGTIAALITAYFSYVWTSSFYVAAVPIGIAAIGWAVLVSILRSAGYRAAEALYRSIEREFPSIVVALRRRAAA